MSSLYNPERGVFIGKLSKYAIAAAVGLAIVAPAVLKADTADPLVAQARLPLKTVTTWITAYASVPEETSNHPFVTASGQWVRDGIVAANFLPFGTRIQIPALFGDKIFVVQDRMNRKFSKRMDIWMPTVAAAVTFGIQRAEIIVLGPPDANTAGLDLATVGN